MAAISRHQTFTVALIIVCTTDSPIYWRVSNVSVSEGNSCDLHLNVDRDLNSTEDNSIPQQEVEVAIIGGTLRLQTCSSQR